jgi:hypothetical protein
MTTNNQPLPAGFLLPPAPALNGYPIVAVVSSLRFSLLPTIAPQPFHICKTGHWSRCVEEDCRLCAGRNPIAARLYGVCIWKPNKGGTLYMPSEWKWPYGCTSFRALALRDSDVSVMRSLRDNVYGYDWQIDSMRNSDKTYSDSVRLVGASSLLQTGDFISKLSLQHTETVDGVTRWDATIMPSGLTKADFDKEAEEMKRFAENMTGVE